MCLAKLYVQANGGDPGTDLLKIRVTSLFGGTEEVQARVTSIDFVEGRLVLQSVEP
jgi:hypothetical protein